MTGGNLPVPLADLGALVMTEKTSSNGSMRTWVEPEIRELNVLETFQLPHVGADIAGNPSPDCQKS